jgi:hypothetical protein
VSDVLCCVLIVNVVVVLCCAQQMMVSLDVTLRPFTVLDKINGPNFITEAQHIADIERALSS